MNTKNSIILAACIAGASSTAAAAPLLDQPLPIDDVLERAESAGEAAAAIGELAEAIRELAPRWTRDAAITDHLRAYLDEIASAADAGRISGHTARNLSYALLAAADADADTRADLAEAIAEAITLPRLTAPDQTVALTAVRLPLSMLGDEVSAPLRDTPQAAIELSRALSLALVESAQPYLAAGEHAPRSAVLSEATLDLHFHAYDYDPASAEVTLAVFASAADTYRAPLWAFGGGASFELDGVFADPICLPIIGLGFLASETEGMSDGYLASETEGMSDGYAPSESDGMGNDCSPSAQLSLQAEFFPSQTEGMSDG
jgi:hypothetical protein